MQEHSSQLNLARKWRSQTFDQIIGQDLVIRILKNSLYKSCYFPVYLFMGQRGCGKTTTARVFAAAINCQERPLFQKDPRKASLPCLVCYSCTTTKSGQHPDFIEIDAASHTGVDNVRQIIDSASFMPVLGEKKVYLIDEAHMLSKAAFNALLKILEEPPLSVIFILATTDAQKIIDTVRSRCFQLFFKPVDSAILSNHLAKMCDQEGIAYDIQGIASVVQQSQGSVRDAQNMIEQVRFTGHPITKASVLAVLGSIDDEHVAQLLLTALYKNPADLFVLIQSLNLSIYNPVYLWKRLHELLRTLIWYKYTKSIPSTMLAFSLDACIELLKYVTIRDVLRALELFYANEALFAASSVQHAFLEMILLQLTQSSARDSDPEPVKESKEVLPGMNKALERVPEILALEVNSTSNDQVSKWRLLVTYIENNVTDQLVVSLFKQAIFVSADQKTVVVSFGQEMQMFVEQLLGTKSIWTDMLEELFGKQVQFVPQFDQKKSTYVSKSISVNKKNEAHDVSAQNQIALQETRKKAAPVAAGSAPFGGQANEQRSQYAYKKRQPAIPMVMGKKIDVSDKIHWPLTHLVLSYFPGRVSALEETVIQQKMDAAVSEVDEQQQYLGDG